MYVRRGLATTAAELSIEHRTYIELRAIVPLSEDDMLHNGGEDISAIVAEIGFSFSRIGFAGHDYPSAHFPSVSIISCCTRLQLLAILLMKFSFLSSFLH